MTNKDEQPSGGHVSGQSNWPLSRPAHALTYEQLAAELNSDVLYGLSTNEAKVRLEQHGRNDLGDEESVQPLKIIVAQIANAMTLVTVSILQPGMVEVLMYKHRSLSSPWRSASASDPGLKVASLPL